MAWDLFNSSSESTTKAPSTGSQTNQGPSTALNVDGYKSNQTINVMQSDQGSISGALSLVGDTVKELIDGVTGLGNRAIDSNTDVTIAAMNKLEDGYYAAGELVRDAVNASLGAVQDGIDFGRDALASNERIVGEALYQAQNITNTAERITESNNLLVRDLNSSNNYLAESLADKVTANSREVLYTISDIQEADALQTSQVIKTVKELAEVVQTGGESITTNANKIVTVLALGIMGLVAWRALS